MNTPISPINCYLELDSAYSGVVHAFKGITDCNPENEIIALDYRDGDFVDVTTGAACFSVVDSECYDDDTGEEYTVFELSPGGNSYGVPTAYSHLTTLSLSGDDVSAEDLFWMDNLIRFQRVSSFISNPIGYESSHLHAEFKAAVALVVFGIIDDFRSGLSTVTYDIDGVTVARVHITNTDLSVYFDPITNLPTVLPETASRVNEMVVFTPSTPSVVLEASRVFTNLVMSIQDL